MSGDDDLRARLAAIDPALPGGALGPVSDPSAAEIQERAMKTLDQPTTSSDAPTSGRSGRARVLAAAAAVVLVAGAGVAGVLATSDDPSPRPSAPTTVALQAAPGGAISSCIQFDVAILRAMPIAVAGTVTTVDEDSVTLDVDRWYAGGSGDRVTVSVPDAQTSVALDGVEFVDGQRYLLTATDGTVNGCGFSGPATPQLEQAYAQAFGG